MKKLILPLAMVFCFGCGDFDDGEHNIDQARYWEKSRWMHHLQDSVHPALFKLALKIATDGELNRHELIQEIWRIDTLMTSKWQHQ